MKQEQQPQTKPTMAKASYESTEELTERINELMDALMAGATIGDIAGISDEQLEILYTVAYGAYQAKNYEDAEVLFQALCLYKHMDARFWLGLGGCRQGRGKYKIAIDAYEMAGLASALGDPTPFLYAGMCFLKLGDKESARIAFLSTAVLCEKGNSEHELVKERAEAMIEAISGGVKQ